MDAAQTQRTAVLTSVTVTGRQQQHEEVRDWIAQSESEGEGVAAASTSDEVDVEIDAAIVAAKATNAMAASISDRQRQLDNGA